jgi:hypothetical protein
LISDFGGNLNFNLQSAICNLKSLREGQMRIELSKEDAELLRDLLRERVLELDKEINRTDSRAFKNELRKLDRATERILGALSAAVEGVARLDDSIVE